MAAYGVDPIRVIRTPDHRLRVFVSSTLQELATERAAVRTAVTHLHLTPVMFEAGARPHPPRALYQAYLEQSDLFVGIYWQQYGWVAPGEDVSGLEDEYRLAGARPKLIYLKLPAPQREARLSALIDALEADGTVSYRTFESADELLRLVEDDLALLLTERFEAAQRPAPGKPTNLPATLSSLVGRGAELTELAALLARTRLLTLTGTGGVGKTRLALQLAVDNAADFSDGAWLTELAGLTDAALVPQAVASALGVDEQPGRSWVDSLIWFLRDRQVLLILDNCEHLLDAVAVLTEAVLRRCARVTVLATSREALKVPGEVAWRVPSLGLSQGNQTSDAEQLFVDRATEADAGYRITSADRPVVAQICQRLDGLPLAIELAAARVRVLSVREIADRLDDRFRLLTDGGRTTLRRQRTLAAAVDWSYQLLSERQRTLFDRLSVFAGGFTLDAAEHVCAGEPVAAADVFDLITELTDRSLLLHERAGQTSRYRMLDTMRAYARDRLLDAGQLATLRDAHLTWANEIARTAARILDGPNQQQWVETITAVTLELDNIRAALGWALDAGDLTTGLGCAASLYRYWYLRGVREGKLWLDRLLSAASTTDTSRKVLAKALCTDGTLTEFTGDRTKAQQQHAQALQLYQSLGNRHGQAWALHGLGMAEWGDRGPAAVKVRFDQALRIFHEINDPVGVAYTLQSLMIWEFGYGDWARAVDYLQTVRVLVQQIGTPNLLQFQPMYASLISKQGTGDSNVMRESLCAELELYRRIGSMFSASQALGAVFYWTAMTGRAQVAARLAGAIDALRAASGTAVPPYVALFNEPALEAARAQLGAERFDAERRGGTALSIQAALDEARSVLGCL